MNLNNRNDQIDRNHNKMNVCPTPTNDHVGRVVMLPFCNERKSLDSLLSL